VNVDEMLGEIGAKHLGEWAEFEAMDPGGERRADMRLAYGLARLAAALTGKAQKPADYLLTLEQKTQDWREMRAQFTMALGAANHAHHRADRCRAKG
jgi:hypothetical protein